MIFEISDIIVTEMCSSDKMTSALLAMSLSYYYVMEEYVEMEKKVDKILATLLICHGSNIPPKHITSMQCKICKWSVLLCGISEYKKSSSLQSTLI